LFGTLHKKYETQKWNSNCKQDSYPHGTPLLPPNFQPTWPHHLNNHGGHFGCRLQSTTVTMVCLKHWDNNISSTTSFSIL
jgi:hypothetical protein